MEHAETPTAAQKPAPITTIPAALRYLLAQGYRPQSRGTGINEYAIDLPTGRPQITAREMIDLAERMQTIGPAARLDYTPAEGLVLVYPNPNNTRGAHLPMKHSETPTETRRRLQVSLLATHAAVRIKAAELRIAADRLTLAQSRIAAAETAHMRAALDYSDTIAAYLAASSNDTHPTRHPAAPLAPIDTYEGQTTYETFLLLHIIDNDDLLYQDKCARFSMACRARDYAARNKAEREHAEQTDPRNAPRIAAHNDGSDPWPHLDSLGHATPQAIDLYATLLMAALDKARKLRDPIDLANVDIDDAIATLAAELDEYSREHAPEITPEP